MDNDVLQDIKFTWTNETGIRGGLGTACGRLLISVYDLNKGPGWFRGIVSDMKSGKHLVYGIYKKGIGIELFETLSDGTSYRFVAVKTIGEEDYHGQCYLIDSIDNIDGLDIGLSKIEVNPVPHPQPSAARGGGFSGYTLKELDLVGEIEQQESALDKVGMELYSKVKGELDSRSMNLGRLYTQENTSKKLHLEQSPKKDND